MLELAALKLAVVESLLPNWTVQLVPPSWIKTNNMMKMTAKQQDVDFPIILWFKLKFINNMKLWLFLTATTESLAATAKMSAQDTTPGQIFSNWDLIVSTTLNPLSELLLGPAVFSPVKVELSSKRTDASHPCYIMLFKLIIFIYLFMLC